MKKKENTRFDVIRWFDSQGEVDRRTMALRVIERLMEIGELRYREGGIEPDGTKTEECLYWESNGEDLRIPF